MVPARPEGAVVCGTLVAGVQNAADPRGDGRLDRIPVEGHGGVSGRVVRRDEKQLIGTVESGGQRGRAGVVATADLETEIGEAVGLADLAHSDDDLADRNALEKLIDGRAVKCSGRSGNDDHDEPSGYS